ncbi:hypothetical protein [Serratia phage SP1]|nr:hypothetical protein [Serratia phage SP1]
MCYYVKTYSHRFGFNTASEAADCMLNHTSSMTGISFVTTYDTASNAIMEQIRAAFRERDRSWLVYQLEKGHHHVEQQKGNW